MEISQYLKNLSVPQGKIDIVLDTDAYNEIDDQFAISYMLLNPQKFNVKGICAAPFLNGRSESAADGMRKSYDEILKLLTLMNKNDFSDKVFKGSESYLTDEITPVDSDAANFMANLAENYSPENPLYIVAIGAITNVASAVIKNKNMTENCVIVWLGGHSLQTIKPASEFNMTQDIAGARVLFGCGVPLVQLPCSGVVSEFATSKYELEHWLKGKNPLCDYLYKNTVEEAESYAYGKAWTRIIWDVTAIGWLLNTNNRFMADRLIPSPIPEYDKEYAFNHTRRLIRYVHKINRDALFTDLFNVLGSTEKF
ncbi:MAG: nucleoside hydrolase [Acutalibacteraceae bacterium]|nr:nucleoside hydrolase [Acutalibacteraceae bacterium]